MLLKLKPFLIVSLLVMSMTLSACSKKSVDTAAENDSADTTVTEEQANTSEDFEKKESEDSPKDVDMEDKNAEEDTNAENQSSSSKEIRHMAETIDISNLPDGKYPVKIFFDNMKKNEDSLSLDFLIYTVVHYDPEDINNMTRDDIIYEYVDETTTKTHVIDTVNFPIDEVCVVNGGSERGEGITFTLEESGLYQISVGEGYTRTASHGMVTMEIPDSVSFEDNFNLENTRLQGAELYDYFNALGDTEKEYFNQNNTFITVSGGKITGFNRIFLP